MDAYEKFHDRQDAGRILAEHVASYAEQDPIVIGLPRGGVPVAYEVARALGAPLDICIVRKIGAPGQPELGIGAVAEGGETFLDPIAMKWVGASAANVGHIVRSKMIEVDERARRFRAGSPPLDVRGRVVIVVDDGIATGGTARAALRALRQRVPQSLILAVPVAAAGALASLHAEADEIICLSPKDPFGAVGYWYEDFEPTSDEDVIRLLQRAKRDNLAADGTPVTYAMCKYAWDR